MVEMKKPEVLAIIPARGGSKGIPRKNIVDLYGLPLIAYSIKAALQTKYITRVVVSTEDLEIAKIAEEFGAEVPFLRPAEIAEDHSPLHESIEFTLTKLKQNLYFPDSYVVLFPTHPFRLPEMMNFCIEKLLEGHRSVITVKAVRHSNGSVFYKDEFHFLKQLWAGSEYQYHNTQLFHRTYGVFVGTNPYGNKRYYNYELTDPNSLLDIDTFEDLFLAEEVLKTAPAYRMLRNG